MTITSSPSRILEAVDALKRFDRIRGASLLREELREGPPTGLRWRSVAMLAAQIGEIDIALEASSRFALTEPVTLERLLEYWGALAEHGRADQALAEVARLPIAVREHPAVLHFLAAMTGEAGDFTRAEDLYRRALAKSDGGTPQTWFALAMIKTFSSDDPDLAAMEQIRADVSRGDPAVHARFLYGLAKAWDDCGEKERAFSLYAQGAALRRSEARFDPAALARFADGLIRDFTVDGIARLTPSEEPASRALFVNGLPRSGTTLVEQILASHSAVGGGAELNLVRAAMIPAGDYSFAGALDYQRRERGKIDPWGDLARDYHRMLNMRFGDCGLVVDKTLSQSHFMGLMLHALPGAKLVWLRREPADAALSCYRSFFSASIPWSWSLADIGAYFRIEDRLYKHWSELFLDRILTVPYEALTREPAPWIARILNHFSLDDEPAVHDFHRTKRNVRTASVQQVRAPISTARIGAAQAYGHLMDEFHEAYGG